VFQLSGSQLQCQGNGSPPQTLAQNVASFQVRYSLQDNTTLGKPKIQYVTATNVDNWGKVQAVEVCLEIYGNEPVDMPAGSTYVNCNGAAVDMTTLAAPRTRRMHLTFRSVYQLRSQGLVGTVL
jgi:type IV pilus assembly protein PilW